MQKSLLTLALFGSAGLAATAHADFINGSFEDPGISPDYNRPVSTGGLPGWSVLDSVLIRNGYDGSGSGTTWHDTSAGSQYLYINDIVGTEGISQAVTLTAGANRLSYLQADFASAFASPGGAIDVTIVRDSDSQTILHQETDTADFSDFVTKTINFTAPTAGSYTFSFAGVGGHAALIDNVHVAAVPEPTTMAAVGLGLVGIARRRRAKGRARK